jgi:antitoxin HicB
MTEYVEFHLSDSDLPPEALRDPMRPPKESTLVHCIHCDEEYDSWRMVYRVSVGHDGKVHGFWCCAMPGCDGAGFQFDIFPVDPNYIAEDGQPQGEWVDCDERDEDCDCEECAASRSAHSDVDRRRKPAIIMIGDTIMARKYNVSDGRLLLTLEEDKAGGYTVTSPMHPGLVTEAETISEAFEMARDALKVLRRGYVKMFKMQRRARSA